MLNKHPIGLILSLSGILFSNVLFAEENELDVVTVTASAIDDSAQLANLAKQNALNGQTIIMAEQLNQFGDQPLGDALRRVSGVHFDGANRAREIQLRGLGAEYTQVTINGRRIIDSSSSRSVQVDRIPSSMVERIEIIHTPLASNDGQGAAGTVNIILKQGHEYLPNQVGIGMGSLQDNGQIGDATFQYSTGNDRVSVTLAGGIQQQRRNESQDELEYAADDQADGGEIKTNERRYEQINLIPTVDITLNNANRLSIEPTFLQTIEFRNDVKKSLTDDQSTVEEYSKEFRKRTRQNTGLYTELNTQISDNIELKSFIDWQDGYEDTTRDQDDFDEQNALTDTKQREQSVDLNLMKIGFRAKHIVGQHALEYGLGLSQETREEDNSEVKNGVKKDPSIDSIYEITESINHLYVQDSLSLFEGNSTTFGLRAEDSKTETIDFADDSTTKRTTSFLPSFNLKQAIDDSSYVRLGVAKTLRRPDLRSLSPTISEEDGTFSDPDTAGNPNATPESILGVDLSFEHYFYDNNGLVSLSVFDRSFEDKLETITTNIDGRFVATPENTGDGSMQGAEIEFRLPLNSIGLNNVTGWFNATAVETEVKITSTGEKRRFLDQPDHLGNLGFDWNLATFNSTIGLSINYASGYDQKHELSDGSFEKNIVDSNSRVDLSIRSEITKNTSINLTALNLFAKTAKREDRFFDSSNALDSYSTTEEPTYRSIYLKLNHTF
ncbi:TonB-dependent receptor [Oleispira antarctica RB-8]|uniref:TonB-dependent receptor n=1 Tax=Oleispira antarctica RB-8 TaxID=698738 RepID=R4YKV4_OLEAN|nr:TonB-dependent receptor [Oleispira antarctica RB-8]